MVFVDPLSIKTIEEEQEEVILEINSEEEEEEEQVAEKEVNSKFVFEGDGGQDFRLRGKKLF